MEEHDHNLTNILESLKAIKPAGDFAARSRTIILAARGPASDFKRWGLGFLERLELGVVLTFVGFLFLVIIGGLSLRAREELNDRKILSEAKKIQFQIRLDEITYFEESAKDVSVALEKISSGNH